MKLTMDPKAWEEGFEAGEAGTPHGACPYLAGTTESWSWFSGYIEGKAKRDGYDHTALSI
jgi:ribosome modulation factor